MQNTWAYYKALLQGDPTTTASGIKSVLQSMTDPKHPEFEKADRAVFIDPRPMAALTSQGVVK